MAETASNVIKRVILHENALRDQNHQMERVKAEVYASSVTNQDILQGSAHRLVVTVMETVGTKVITVVVATSNPKVDASTVGRKVI